MLKRLYVHNFRTLVNFEFEPGPFTLLLGANGSGKSTLLEVMECVKELTSGSPCHEVFTPGARSLLTNNNQQSVELSVELDGKLVDYRLSVVWSGVPERPRIQSEVVFVNRQAWFTFIDGELSLSKPNGAPGPVFRANWEFSALSFIDLQRPEQQLLQRLRSWLGGVQPCRIQPYRIVSGVTADSGDTLDPDCGNIASWLKTQVGRNLGGVEAYFESLRSVVQGFASLRFEQVGPSNEELRFYFPALVGNTIAGASLQIVLNKVRPRELQLAQLSEGQRCLVVLYALLHFGPSEHGRLMMFDEPDNYVALSEIRPWVRRVLDASIDGELQTIVVSHHPEVMEEVAMECGHLLYRDGNGPTRCVRMRELESEMAELGLSVTEYIGHQWHSKMRSSLHD